MTTYAYTSSFNNTGVAINLALGDNLFIAENANISSTGASGIYGPGGSSVTVAGNIFANYVGLWFTESSTNYILVNEGGSISGLSYGIYESGNNSTITNAGTVSGYYALSAVGNNPEVHNYGLITGSTGVSFSSSSRINLLTNDGKIDALTAVSGSTSSDHVYNTGLIRGAVDLYGGDDFFDSRGGTTQGTVNLGNGNDTAYGGLGADSIDGGDGLDRLRGKQGEDRLDGGLGNDTLTGGADEDEFLFSTALGSNNVDKITDFRHGEDIILLDDLIFAALGTDIKSNEVLIRSSGHTATKASHHIIYDNAKGTLWYDADGKGGAAAIKFAQLGTSDDHPTNLNYHDFQIV